jgi:Mg2+ and Co2+ transporter CorA
LDVNEREFRRLGYSKEEGVSVRLEHRSNVFFTDQSSPNPWEELPIYKLPIQDQFTAMCQRFDIHIKQLVDSIQPFHRDYEATTTQIFLWGAAKASSGFQSYLIREQGKVRTAVCSKARGMAVGVWTLNMMREYRDSMLDCQSRISSLMKNLKDVEAKERSRTSTSRDEHLLAACSLQNDLKTSLKTIDDILRDLERMMADAFADLQLELTNTQIRESRKSIEQNATVKRLTALAFVFIPLSTIASIFGMNIPEISPSPLWKFLVTSATVITAVVFVALFESMVRLFRKTSWLSLKTPIYKVYIWIVRRPRRLRRMKSKWR